MGNYVNIPTHGSSCLSIFSSSTSFHLVETITELTHGTEYFSQGFLVMLFTFTPFSITRIVKSKNQKLSALIRRGTEDAMNYLSEEAYKGRVESILFLMPCHSTPYYSTLHSNIPMQFLDCTPSEEKGTLDESDRFLIHPLGFVSEIAGNWSEPPSHIVTFASEETKLRDFIIQRSFKEASYRSKNHFLLQL
ncbi:hypothetical protein F2Q69_00017528 [Brassica cretica]|uniref:Mannosyltransferase n=1 Tax=Brassica cretica TaxID=69181 RepID=A0A8S9R2S0_BRACR|nr:hypothetical protein F2Q69_00017528 [Brassica cretica]